MTADRSACPASRDELVEHAAHTCNYIWSYATYWRDSFTGLDYANQRYYSNVQGRFMTPDSYKAFGLGANDPKNPQSWNHYAYVVGDPVNRVDPAGQDYDDPDDLFGDLPFVDLSLSPSTPSGDWSAYFLALAAQIAAQVVAQVKTLPQNLPLPNSSCSLQLQYSPALGSSAVSHSNLVFTDGWGYTISVEGYSQSQEPGFQPSSILSPFGNLLIQNLAGNPHNMGWGNTLTSAVDPGLCNQIGDIEGAELYYASNEVSYYPWGPNSNSLIHWLLQSGFVSQLFTAPPNSSGWNTPLYGTLLGIPGSGGNP